MANFWKTYANQTAYETYSDRTFIEDALYAIGVALDEKYTYAEGYREFQTFLMKFLKKQNPGNLDGDRGSE